MGVPVVEYEGEAYCVRHLPKTALSLALPRAMFSCCQCGEEADFDDYQEDERELPEEDEMQTAEEWLALDSEWEEEEA